MKKMKKLFAVLLTLAMVLGMSMTSFAAETSQIKVTGLSSQENETVNLYPAITWDEENSKWNVATWASGYIQLVGNKYEITDAEGLTAAVAGTPHTQTHSAGSTEVTFDNIPVGAYVITASGNKISYAPMVAETYNKDAIYMEAKNVEVVAESDIDDTKINVGCHIIIHDFEYDEDLEFSIVGSTQTNSLSGKISNESPLGHALIGHEVGDIVEVEMGDTVSKYKVLDIKKKK